MRHRLRSRLRATRESQARRAGQWRSDAKKLLQYCLRPGALGLHFVEQLQPDDDDYLILKPMHSALYQTPLELLLRELGASSIILWGRRPTAVFLAPGMTLPCGISGSSCRAIAARHARRGNTTRRWSILEEWPTRRSSRRLPPLQASLARAPGQDRVNGSRVCRGL